MTDAAMVRDAVRAHYPGARVLACAGGDDGIRLRLVEPLTDILANSFRSGPAILNHLAIAHRLTVLLGPSRTGVPEGHSLAIASIETEWREDALTDEGAADGCELFLRFDISATRGGQTAAFTTTLETRGADGTRSTTMAFRVLPPLLVTFVRRQRGFSDFPLVRIGRDEPELLAVAGGGFRYEPSEADRLSDGVRMDHIPALTLIDIGLSACDAAVRRTALVRLSAKFVMYSDPRHPIDMVVQGLPPTIRMLQHGCPTALMEFGPARTR